MAETVSVQLDVSAEAYGALLACVSGAAERVLSPAERRLLEDLENTLRDALRQVLGPMSIGEGMRLTRAIESAERAVAAVLSAHQRRD